MRLHEGAGALQTLASQVRALRKNGLDLLFMYLGRPLCAEEIRDGQLHQQVAKRRRIEHAGVQERGEAVQDSITHAQLLRLRGELIQHFPPLPVDRLLESDHVLEADSPVRPDAAERQLLLLQQVN